MASRAPSAPWNTFSGAPSAPTRAPPKLTGARVQCAPPPSGCVPAPIINSCTRRMPRLTLCCPEWNVSPAHVCKRIWFDWQVIMWHHILTICNVAQLSHWECQSMLFAGPLRLLPHKNLLRTLPHVLRQWWTHQAPYLSWLRQDATVTIWMLWWRMKQCKIAQTRAVNYWIWYSI